MYGAPCFLTGKEEEIYKAGYQYMIDINCSDLYPFPDCSETWYGTLKDVFEQYEFLKTNDSLNHIKEEIKELMHYEDQGIEFELPKFILDTDDEKVIELFLRGYADSYMTQSFNIYYYNKEE